MCRYKENNPGDSVISYKCALCLKSDNFLYRYRQGNKQSWIHYICAQWFSEIQSNIENSFIVFKSPSLNGEVWIGECKSCHKTIKNDFLVKCRNKSCNFYYHTKCVQNREMIKKSDNLDSITFLCEEHRIYLILKF